MRGGCRRVTGEAGIKLQIAVVRIAARDIVYYEWINGRLAVHSWRSTSRDAPPPPREITVEQYDFREAANAPSYST